MIENAKRAQQRLIAKGFVLDDDGDFGPASLAALMSYVGSRPSVTLLRMELGKAADQHLPPAGINSALRLAHVMAQQSVETSGFSAMVEGFNYTAETLRKTFGAHRISDAECKRLGRKKKTDPPLSAEVQAEIANLVYGGEWGRKNLGNVAPGHGWKYRGRGAKQTTGLTNYAQVTEVTKIDVVNFPDRLADPMLGMEAAAIFWRTRNCNVFADRDDIKELTKAINGGNNGLPDRRAALLRAKAILL
jgi:putative chitinase